MASDGPRLRRDLISTVLQVDGVRHVDVFDPKRGSTFRLFDYEYSVALAFDGRPLAKVIPWVHLSTGLDLTEEQLTSFAQRLGQLGFLELGPARTPGVVTGTPSPAVAPEPAAPQDMTLSPEAGPDTASLQAAPADPLPLLPEAEPASPADPLPSQTPHPAPASLFATDADEDGEAVAPPLSDDHPVHEPEPVLPVHPVPDKDEIPLPGLVPHPRSRAAAPAANLPLVDHLPVAHPHPVPPAVLPRSLTPGPRLAATPPPIPTSAAYVTPPPVVPGKARKGPWIFYALFGVLAAMAVGVLAVPLALKPRPPIPAQVHVLIAKPTEVLRWFDVSAPVESLPSQVLNFPVGGKVMRLTSPGIGLRPGDVLAATDAARGALADLARRQEKLAYLEQVAGGALEMGNEERANAKNVQAEASAELLEKLQMALAPVAVLAKSLGQVEVTLANLGQKVQAGAPAVRFKPAGWRARFELTRPEAARVRKQGLCQAEIAGQVAPCTLAPDGDETHVVIELLQDAASTQGQSVRLARNRLSGVFVVPASALSHIGNSDRVFVVAPMGRAEERSVAVADRTASDSVITQGLDAGDAVIIQTSQPIAAGARIRITRVTRE
jgi:hypothetical protein